MSISAKRIDSHGFWFDGPLACTCIGLGHTPAAQCFCYSGIGPQHLFESDVPKMNTPTFLIVAFFNLLIWWVIVTRLIALAHAISRRAAILFSVGMLLQGSHSVLLVFSSFFKAYTSGKVINAAETICAVASAYLLLLFAQTLLEYALDIDSQASDLQNKQVPIGLVVAAPRTALGLRIATAVIIMISVLFELVLAGEVSNLLTPSSTDVRGNWFLLANRVITMGYIVVVEGLIAYELHSLLATDYGERGAVQVRIWGAIICCLFHASHFVANLLTTGTIFFLGKDSVVGNNVQAGYALYDTIVLIPLGLSFFIAVGPRRLIESIYGAATTLWYWRCFRHISWLRNLLTRYCPQVQLPGSGQIPVSRNPIRSLSYLSVRYLIECSDAIHLLLQSLTDSDCAEVLERPPTGGRLSAEELEVHLVSRAIDRVSTGQLSSFGSTHTYLDLPSFQARSVSELMTSYLRLAAGLKRIFPNT